jgi:mRNA interferase MazF
MRLETETYSMRPRRGEIWNVRFDPATGAEIQKTRPAVVVSIDEVGRLPLAIVVPVTDWKTRYNAIPWLILLEPTLENGLTKQSAADSFQVKSVSVDRFVERLGTVPSEYLDSIAEAIALCIGYRSRS